MYDAQREIGQRLNDEGYRHKRSKHCDSVALQLGKLGVFDHLRKQNKPELVATLVKKVTEKS